MLWILQNNFVSPMTAPLARHLRETGRQLLDFSVPLTDSFPERVLAAAEQAQGHFMYGSTVLERRACAHPELGPHQLQNLTRLDPRVWVLHRSGQLLNERVARMTLGDLKAATPKVGLFVKPATEQKAFTGVAIRDGNLAPIYMDRAGRRREQRDDLLVDISPLQELGDEYRFLVRRGDVITGSQYRNVAGSYIKRVTCSNTLALARELSQGWLPAEVSMMDMAVLADGTPRIIEFNSVHSAGHYDMDRELLCQALEFLVHARHKA